MVPSSFYGRSPSGPLKIPLRYLKLINWSWRNRKSWFSSLPDKFSCLCHSSEVNRCNNKSFAIDLHETNEKNKFNDSRQSSYSIWVIQLDELSNLGKKANLIWTRKGHRHDMCSSNLPRTSFLTRRRIRKE